MAGTYKTEVKNAPSKHLCYSFTVAEFFSTGKFSNVRQRVHKWKENADRLKWELSEVG